jgi:hypothetical protein
MFLYRAREKVSRRGGWECEDFEWRVGDEVLIGTKAIISKLNENKYVLKIRSLAHSSE